MKTPFRVPTFRPSRNWWIKHIEEAGFVRMTEERCLWKKDGAYWAIGRFVAHRYDNLDELPVMRVELS